MFFRGDGEFSSALRARSAPAAAKAALAAGDANGRSSAAARTAEPPGRPAAAGEASAAMKNCVSFTFAVR